MELEAGRFMGGRKVGWLTSAVMLTYSMRANQIRVNQLRALSEVERESIGGLTVEILDGFAV